MIGAFAVRNAHLDVLIMVLFGLIGIILVATDYPLVSVVIGVIVGGFAEEGFVQGWIINQSDPIRFLTTSDIAIVLLLLIAFSLGVTLIRD